MPCSSHSVVHGQYHPGNTVPDSPVGVDVGVINHATFSCLEFRSRGANLAHPGYLEGERQDVMHGEAVFRIAKMVAGQDVWLIEANPSVAWGCRAKAIGYGSADGARAALAALPLRERDTAIVAIGN
jgi:hypothetical protein